MFANPEELLRYLKNEGVKFVDVRFCDLPGVMQHFTVPVESFDETVFRDGLAFDGSSIRGFQQIHESDMLLLPDVATSFLDPFRVEKTLALNFFIHDPFTREAYSRDPRNVAKKAETYLASSGIADTAYFGAEAEFYIFDSIRHSTGANEAYYYIDSVEGWWNSGKEEPGGNRGYKTAYKGGYFPVPPVDHYADLRDQMVRNLVNLGLTVERAHHEVGTAGQAEINYKFSTLLLAGDTHAAVQVRGEEHRVARRQERDVHAEAALRRQRLRHAHATRACGPTASRCSTTRPGTAACPTSPAGTSVACCTTHRRCCAFTNPTVNSYRRLVPGFEAPVNLVYSQRNRSACTRIPVTGTNAKAKRIEFRVPDPSCNPYLAFSAMLMAGLDGVRNKIEPPAPIDKDLYDLPPEEVAQVTQVPGSLPEVLDALEKDHEYLLEGGVFTPDLIETWIDYKKTAEIDPVRLRPTPHEFAMYYDV